MQRFLTVENQKNFNILSTENLIPDSTQKKKKTLETFEYLDIKNAIKIDQIDYDRNNTKISDLKKVIQLQREKNNMELNLYKDKIEKQFDEITRLEEKLDSLKRAEEDIFYA